FCGNPQPGGPEAAEDAMVLVHEYGHSIQDNVVPGWGQTEEGGAMGEGFGDYNGASPYSDIQPAWKYFPAEWFSVNCPPLANRPSLRTLNSTKHYPQDVDGEVHDDGEMWSASLYQIRDMLGRTATDTLVYEHHFLLSPTAVFADGANAMVATDNMLNGGANAFPIRQIFVDRGFLAPLPFFVTRPNGGEELAARRPRQLPP